MRRIAHRSTCVRETLEMAVAESPVCTTCARIFWGRVILPDEDGVVRCPHCGSQILGKIRDSQLYAMTRFGGSEL